jgi:hypothetical protein
MAELEKVTRGATKMAKRAKKGEGPLGSPAGLAATGAAIAAVPFVAEKLARVAGPKISDKAGDVAEGAKSRVRDAARDAMPDSPGELLGGGPLKRLFGGSNGSGSDEENGRAAPGHVFGRNEQRSAISTVEASASGMSANSTAISARVLKR